MTRAHITDPDLVNKAAEGRFDDIRHCIGCVQGCIKRIFDGMELTCTQNPITGREGKYANIPIISGKSRLVVVGGGPAGMEAARLGAERGFDVVLLEKDQELGGQVRLMCKSIPEREEFNEIVRWRKIQLDKLGVDIRTGVTADAATIKELGASLVIVATGALPRNIGVPGSDAANVFTDLEWVTENREIGDNVLIVDKVGRSSGLVIADHLTKQDKKVTIVTQLWFPGQKAGFQNIAFMYMGILQHETQFIPNSALVSVDDGEATIVNVYSGQTSSLGKFDTILTITPPIANDGLFRELLDSGVKCLAVGDALSPRDAQCAIRDAFDAVAALQV
ncbi:MAG: FAD-dependent oxidoreductase, partial [Georgfuchsia sp.]